MLCFLGTGHDMISDMLALCMSTRLLLGAVNTYTVCLQRSVPESNIPET